MLTGFVIGVIVVVALGILLELDVDNDFDFDKEDYNDDEKHMGDK